MLRISSAFLDQLEAPPVTRFAPSPTGYLHLGHVASALYVWGIGRALGARILLRIEDHDTTRCRPAFETAIFDDLAWLGLNFDNHETDAWRKGHSAFRQSDQHAVYDSVIAQLEDKDLIYACDCSRKRIQLAMQMSLEDGDEASEDPGELRYDGHCRHRHLPIATPGAGLRLILPDKEVAFRDGILGHQQQFPAKQCGDMLLRDRHGCYTYQFAASVDDLRQGVNLVMRGQDLTSSTGRQILFGRILGRKKDALFLHHPLLVDENGRKLGKRFYSAAVAQRREAGEDAAVVLGEAAQLLGLIPARRPLAIDEALSLFHLG